MLVPLKRLTGRLPKAFLKHGGDLGSSLRRVYAMTDFAVKPESNCIGSPPNLLRNNRAPLDRNP